MRQDMRHKPRYGDRILRVSFATDTRSYLTLPMLITWPLPVVSRALDYDYHRW
jgi:hypothetical protein